MAFKATSNPLFDRQTMKEIKLSQADKERIMVDIKLTLIITLFFTIALVVLIGIIPLILFIFEKNPAYGFVNRGVFIIGLLLLPFLAISWKNIIKYVDLKTGKKINFQVTSYDIKKTKDGLILETKDPLKLKLELYDKLLPLIKPTEPITIEITKLSKTLLFLSHDSNNLMDLK